MAATLLVVVASQVPALTADPSALASLAGVVPFYAVFLFVMAFAGLAVARLFRLGTGDGRAVVFTGATRNSLVVLPLALALPANLALAAAIVVTQTLVEVVGMIIYMRAVPWLLPERGTPPRLRRILRAAVPERALEPARHHLQRPLLHRGDHHMYPSSN
ncbi:hypothetical protein [Nonomuraea sp. bgisy101]|uniref:hypothetical protein n=1 Tax=Nonomuraea sp. bgisy101 TaxID=3413784 RepID=UPI003D71363C